MEIFLNHLGWLLLSIIISAITIAMCIGESKKGEMLFSWKVFAQFIIVIFIIGELLYWGFKLISL